MSSDWMAPENWAADVEAAVRAFVTQTGIHKEDLARALGISPSSLSPSHLGTRRWSRNVYQTLPYVLRRDALFSAARDLHLDMDGFQALKALACRVVTLSSGYAVDPERAIERGWEVVEAGMLGVDFFDQGDWPIAVPYLQHSWSFLKGLNPAPGSTGYSAALRVGTQLASWQCYANKAGDALQVTKQLLGLARSYKGDDPQTIRATCLFYKGAGTVLRHSGWHPEYVIEKMQIADRISQEHGLSPLFRIASLRDQAKPHVLWGLKENGRLRQAHFAAALAALDQSEDLAVGQTADAAAEREWLFTRLTKIECLTAMGRYSEAEQVWEETMSAVEIAAILAGAPRSALAAKLRFAQMAVLLAQGQLDRLAAAADGFTAEFRNQPFDERLQRAVRIARLACARDRDTLHRVIAT